MVRYNCHNQRDLKICHFLVEELASCLILNRMLLLKFNKMWFCSPFKGKDNKTECKNDSGIKLLTVSRKVLGRILTKRTPETKMRNLARSREIYVGLHIKFSSH